MTAGEIAFLRTVPSIGRTERLFAPAGASVRQIADGHIGGGRALAAFLRMPDGTLCAVPEPMWGHVRPRRHCVVEFHARLSGGGEDSVLALVAAIAITAIAGPAGTAVSAALFGGNAAAAALVTGGILLGGNLLASQLFAGEPQRQGATAAAADPAGRSAAADVTTDANLLARDAYPPRIFGGPVRISPPDAVNPHVYFDAGVETVERLLALSGPHEISDIKISGVPAATHPSLTVETKSGRAGAGLITSVTRYTVPSRIGEELSSFASSGTELEDQDKPSNAEPRWHGFALATDAALSELTVNLAFDGFANSSSDTDKVLVPLRMRFRPVGSATWNNLPEIWAIVREPKAFRRQIRFRWDSRFGTADIDGQLVWKFFQQVPAATSGDLSDGSTGVQWQSHSHFVNPSVPSPGLQQVVNISAQRFGVRVDLDEAVFAKGRYEFQIMRGAALVSTSIDDDYRIAGTVHSLFRSYDDVNTWSIPKDQGGFFARVTAVSGVSVMDDTPVQRPGTALIALNSRGQGFTGVTCQAAGDAPDWDGAAWATSGQSDNPATQTRQLLDETERHFRIGKYSRFARIAALGTSVVDDAAFVAWRAQCIKSGARVALPVEGAPLDETLQRMFAAGFARPVYGPRWSVDFFRHTESIVAPDITFSPRNGTSITALYENAPRPMGMRAKFRNRDKDWAQDEVEARSPVPSDTQNWLSVEIDGVDDADLVRQRLEFDMLRGYFRRTTYVVETAIEGLALKPGDMVGLVTDLVGDRAHGARVREVVDAQTLTIDQVIAPEAADADYSATADDYDDFFETGEQSYLLLTTPTGCELRRIVAATAGEDSMTVTVDIAFSSTDLDGAHLAIGSLGQTVRRCLVLDVPATGEFGTRIMLVDEAPEIYRHFVDKWGWQT